jgi:hypothetical protein
MPIHDWSTIEPGIFHDFHHGWIYQLAKFFNQGGLSDEYYALIETRNSHFGARASKSRAEPGANGDDAGDAETVLEFYRSKQNVVAIRHVSDERLVAIVEIVSSGNKSSQAVFRKFLDKAVDLLSQDIHLLIIDLMPPTRRDPNGIHGAIWEALTDEQYVPPTGKPLTLAAYDSEMGVRAFVEAVSVGDILMEMPLFLKAGAYVPVGLDSTYQSAWETVPRRWRSVIEGASQ